jgi:hypothetical protein
MGNFREAAAEFVRNAKAASSEALAKAAHHTQRRIVDQQRGRYGVDPGVVSAVDGERGREFEEVKPDGVIWLGFDYRREAIAFAFDAHFDRSPVDSGDYALSTFCSVDGVSFPPRAVPPQEAITDATEIVITSPVPYARRLEVGLDKTGAAFVKQVEPHIFESVAATVRRKYGKVMKVEFGYVDLPNVRQGANALAHYRLRRNYTRGRLSLSGRSDREMKQRARVRYPAIVITRKSA